MLFSHEEVSRDPWETGLRPEGQDKTPLPPASRLWSRSQIAGGSFWGSGLVP